MKTKQIARIVLGVALAMSFAGCMSMDEMLASDSGVWRDIGETKAVAFATSSENTLQERLAVVPKIKDQEKLAKIYLSASAAPEVKKAAREGITETKVFVYIILNSTDKGSGRSPRP